MAKRQGEIPGTERKTVKEIDDAAEAYLEARDKRMKLSEKEKVAKDALISVMKKHSVTVYRDDQVSPPLVVTLVPGKDGVQVRAAEDEGDGEGSGEEVEN